MRICYRFSLSSRINLSTLNKSKIIEIRPIILKLKFSIKNIVVFSY